MGRGNADFTWIRLHNLLQLLGINRTNFDEENQNKSTEFGLYFMLHGTYVQQAAAWFYVSIV